MAQLAVSVLHFVAFTLYVSSSLFSAAFVSSSPISEFLVSSFAAVLSGFRTALGQFDSQLSLLALCTPTAQSEMPPSVDKHLVLETGSPHTVSQSAFSANLPDDFRRLLFRLCFGDHSVQMLEGGVVVHLQKRAGWICTADDLYPDQLHELPKVTTFSGFIAWYQSLPSSRPVYTHEVYLGACLLEGLQPCLDPDSNYGLVAKRDRYVTGGLVYALTPAHRRKLMTLQASGDRCYLVSVEGAQTVPQDTWFRTTLYLQKYHPPNASVRVRVSRTPEAGYVVTRCSFLFLDSNQGKQLLLCKLQEGYTHQIRTHVAALLGGWVEGDAVYGQHRSYNATLALHAYYTRFSTDSVLTPVPLGSPIRRYAVISAAGRLSLNDITTLLSMPSADHGSSVTTFGLEQYDTFRAWRKTPPTLLSDESFRNMCNQSISGAFGARLAPWFEGRIQRIEYWRPCSNTGEAPTSWTSLDSPPLVFRLPSDVHTYNLQCIYDLYETDGLFTVERRHSPQARNQSKAVMPILCLSKDQLQWAVGNGPTWLVAKLATIVKLNGSSLGREFAAVDSARQAVIRDQSCMMLPLYMQVVHRCHLYRLKDILFHRRVSLPALLAACGTGILYQLLGDHGVVARLTGMTGKKQAGSTERSGTTKDQAAPRLAARSALATSEDAKEYLDSVVGNLSVRAVRAKFFQQAEPKLWLDQPEHHGDVRLKPSSDGVPKLPKCRAIDYGEGEHSVHGSLLAFFRKQALKHAPLEDTFTLSYISDSFAVSNQLRGLQALRMAGHEVPDKLFLACRLTSHMTDDDYSESKQLLAPCLSWVLRAPCLSTDLAFQDKRQLLVHIQNGPAFAVSSYLLSLGCEEYKNTLPKPFLDYIDTTSRDKLFAYCNEWAQDALTATALLRELTVADCLTYLQNLIRPGGSEDAYALQCAQLRMVTPSGLVVRQLRQQDGLHSELSATCSGQGHVAEHNTEDASTVYVACTPRLSSESVQACLPPGCELPPASHALPGNPFTHQVVDLYLAHFAWDTVSLRFEAYGSVADDERQVVDDSLVERTFLVTRSFRTEICLYLTGFACYSLRGLQMETAIFRAIVMTDAWWHVLL